MKQDKQSFFSNKKYERVNFLIPRQTMDKLRQQVPSGQRSKLISGAIDNELRGLKARDVYKELLAVRAKMPKVSTEEIVRWVREDRQSH